MGKSFGNPKHDIILFAELYAEMPSIGGRRFTDIEGNIKHSPFYHPYQLTLRKRRRLEMQSPQCTLMAHALVVLHKIKLKAMTPENLCIVCFKKIAPLIPKNFWLDHKKA